MDMHRHAMKAKGNFNICSDTDIRTWDFIPDWDKHETVSPINTLVWK